MGRLGADLGPSGAILDLIVGDLGPSWGHLGSSSAILGCIGIGIGIGQDRQDDPPWITSRARTGEVPRALFRGTTLALRMEAVLLAS